MAVVFGEVPAPLLSSLPHTRPPATRLGLAHLLTAHFHLRRTINRAPYHFKAHTCNVSSLSLSHASHLWRRRGEAALGGTREENMPRVQWDGVSQSKRTSYVEYKGLCIHTARRFNNEADLKKHAV